MRLAVLSDIHADVYALADALARLERLHCDAVVCAGDLVDYGLFPAETIALLRERRIACIRGNHDRWAVGSGRADAPDAAPGGEPHDTTGWDLSSDAVAFLAALPPAWDATIEGVRVAVRHGTPRSDMDGIYPDRADESEVGRRLREAAADVLLVGHTHLPFVLQSLAGGVIANPGALGRTVPEDRVSAMILDPVAGTFASAPPPGGGTFGVLELPAKRFTVHRASDGAQVEVPRATTGFRDRRRR